MQLTGLQIYKLLPATNCRDCGFPTCLAFAMKLAAKQAELKLCPYVTEAAQAKLEAAATPPIRLITLTAADNKLEAGNETALFRHEKTFYHRPGLFVRLDAEAGPEAVLGAIASAEAYSVDYVGMQLGLDGFALDGAGATAEVFGQVVAAARAASRKQFILMAANPAVLTVGAAAAAGSRPLLYAADETNWEAVAGVAREAKAPLAVRAANLEQLATLTEALKKAGVEDLVLDPVARPAGASLTVLTQLRRLAVRKNFRALGYPIITFPGESPGADHGLLAAQHIAKYAGFIVLERFDPAELYPLLVLRQNIYTDPQKPIQVQPGLYAINAPTADSPVMVTTICIQRRSPSPTKKSEM